MDAFTKKTVKTSRGYTYTYYTFEGNRSLPALFFQHGWPDHAALWKDVATPLRDLQFPIIIPDLLGYDGTDKPTDPKEYRWDLMTKDLVDIIDAEGVGKVISIGHDWGSGCASRLYQYHPERVVGLVNLNVAYMAPGREPWDLEAINASTEKMFGYPLFSYWTVFAAEDGPALLGNNLERIYNAMHGEAQSMKKFFCEPNAMREYLTTGNAEVKLRPYAQDEKFKQAFIDRMSRDGFEGPQCWYVAMNTGIQSESDKNLPKERDTVNVPALYIGATDDAVCRPEAAIPAIQAGLLPDYTQTDLIDASHWVPYERPEGIVERLRPWLQKRFLS